jgi:peptidoglycan hydrolase-like protein with peptidoglycan-binding domain
VRAYLQRFPSGIFVDLGKLSERRLCGVQRKVSVAESVDRLEPALTPVAPGLPVVVATQPALNSAASVPAPTSAAAGGVLVAALPAPVTAAPPAIRATGPSSQDMARTVQLELYRLGCGPSSADGKWNGATREGLRRFSRAVRVKLDLDSPSDATITALQKQNGRVCPLECGRGMQARGDSCVAIKHDPPKARRVERSQRQRHQPVEASAPPPSAPPPSAPPPMMMGPMGGGFGGGMMFFGMGRRH